MSSHDLDDELQSFGDTCRSWLNTFHVTLDPGDDNHLRLPVEDFVRGTGSKRPLTNDTKTQKKGRHLCYYCGHSARILSGGSKGFYEYKCDEGGCGQSFQKSREPGDDGLYKILPVSKSKKDPYRCGKCGVKPKRDHICLAIGQVTATRPSDESLDMIEPEVASAAAVLIGPILPSGAGKCLQSPGAASSAEAASEASTSTAHSSTLAVAMSQTPPATQPNSIQQTPVTPPLLQPKATALSSAPESDMSAAPPEFATMTTGEMQVSGATVHERLGLVKKKVMGDGSCWIYAILAALGLCDHAHKDLCVMPSPYDRGRDSFCRMFCRTWLEENSSHLDLSEDDKARIRNLDKLPSYPLKYKEHHGTHGSMPCFLGLAALLQVGIVIWNQTTLHDVNCSQQAVEYIGATDDTDRFSFDRVQKQCWTNHEVLRRSQTKSFIHVAWDGSNHYSALVAPADSIPVLQVDKQARLLLYHQRPLDLKKHSASTSKQVVEQTSLPVDWKMFENKMQPIFENCEVHPIESLSLSQHFEKAIALGFNAIAITEPKEATQITYIFYEGVPEEQECYETFDFESVLYVYAGKVNGKVRTDGRRRHHLQMCPCRKLYRANQEMKCQKCQRWYHPSCVVSYQDLKNLDVAHWTCPSCNGRQVLPGGAGESPF